MLRQLQALAAEAISAVARLLTNQDPQTAAECGTDADFVEAVWGEVGGDLRDAMDRYPLEQAARDAAAQPTSDSIL